jgi:hypothetical protein
MSWFTPKCPVDADSKEWIENAFNWLIDAMGREILRDVEVVLPTEEYFPDAYDGSRTSIRRMVERVCGYMDVDPKNIELQFFDSEDDQHLHPLAVEEGLRQHDLGSYLKRRDGRQVIKLDVNQSRNPEMMVATIAHELAHAILLGEERLDPEHPDQEPITDLLTVFYGLGIFNANTTVVFEQFTNTQYQGWRVGGGGYLTEEAFGYALALFAYSRGESKPDWQTYLNINVRSYFRSGLKYLAKTGDSAITRVSLASAEVIKS